MLLVVGVVCKIIVCYLYLINSTDQSQRKKPMDPMLSQCCLPPGYWLLVLQHSLVGQLFLTPQLQW